MKPGTVIAGRYELIQPVGEGGMATVWRGVSRSTAHFTRQVAIKVMKASFAPAQQALDMFLEEARIGAELQHAHLIQVLDFVSEHSGQHVHYYLVMEWIEGCDLRTLLRTMARQAPVPWRLVAHVGAGVLRGLAAAHERRLPDGSPAPVIHRDISPQNILLGLNGAIKLADFGFARARDRSSKATAPGMVKGTVSYMAPETLHGRPASAQTDLYSLACTMWEALAGERLFDGVTDIDVIKKIRAGATRPLDEFRPDVPPRLAAAIDRALALDPAARQTSARAMVQELGEILRDLPPWTDPDVVVGTTVAQARDS